MAGSACVKKFRNCEVAMRMDSLKGMIEAFHQIESDPRVSISDAHYAEAGEIDERVSTVLADAFKRYRDLGIKIGEAQ